MAERADGRCVGSRRAVSAAAPAARDRLGAFHTSLTGFQGFLDRHLTDEEDLVVPVLLKYAPAGLV